MKYSVVTFGCRVNQADSLRIEEALRGRGGRPAEPREADVVVVNTCSVTAAADQGSRQVIRRIARENPRARVVVTGCYASRRPDEVAALPNVLRVIPNSAKEGAATAAADLLTTAERFAGADGPCGAALEPGVAGRTAFTLRVQTGCEERCTYCIIPTTRGPARSLPMTQVVADVRRAAEAGYKEVVLAGVHLGAYGRDFPSPATLSELLRTLTDLDVDVTYRISSLEPMDCSPEIVSLIARSGGRLAPHFHLPLQHASDGILVRMGRPYTLADYRRVVDAIVSALPHASVGSDVIAGFPGESDDDFHANLDYLPASALSHLHVFPYSDRPGTLASRLADKVGGAVVRERAAVLRAIGASLARRFRDRQVGTVRAGLTIGEGSTVLTDNYLKLPIAAGLPRNQRVRVVVEQTPSGLSGRVCV